MSPKNSTTLLVSALIATLSVATACGGGGGGGATTGTPTPSGTNTATPTPSGTQPPGGSFLPSKVGNVWHYDVTAPGVATVTKTVTIAAYEDIGGAKAGTMGFRFDTALSTNASQKEWQVDQGSVILRERAQAFDTTAAIKSDAIYNPSKLYVDETAAHTATGAMWTEAYDDSTLSAATGQTTTTHHVITWTVVSSSASVATAAGTFPCLEVHRVSNQTATAGSDKIYWFAQGVGKVQEEDYNPANPSGTPTQTEKLTSYTLVP